MQRAMVVVASVVLGLSSLSLAAEKALPADRVRIAMVSTLFRDTPPSLASVMMQPFAALMEAQTGLAGEMVPGGDASQVGRLLAEEKAHIGVFHGFEFAWARQKYPELRPLMIAVNQRKTLEALIVTRSDAAAATLADLKSQSFAVPRCTREHCHLYLDHRCAECGQQPANFFSAVTTPPSIEDALDDVVDRVVQGAIVDAVSLKCYERRKPSRFGQLKVVQRSESFPAAVVAYRPGALDDATVERFRTGLINANKGALGRQFMTLWKLTAFLPVPDDYEQTLAEIIKAYPAPAKPDSKPAQPTLQASE